MEMERPSSPSKRALHLDGFSFRFIYALKIFLFLYNPFEISEKEHSAGGGADKSEKDSLQMENTLNYDNH